MKAAVGRVEITTEKVKANDELYAKILLLQQEERIFALISVDYISLGGEIGTISDAFFPKLKTRLSTLGIKDVLCGTTHTHTFEPMVLSEDVILNNISKKTEELLKDLQEVSVEYTTAKENSFIVNRNIPTKNGEDWTIRLAHALPPENSYDKLAFADDTASVLQFKKVDGSTLCILFNFGCHPLLGKANNVATANFPGEAERVIETHTGGVAMMFQSTGGDVCEVDYKNYFQPKDFKAHGVALGESVVKALKNSKPLTSEISAITVEKVFPLRSDYAAEIERLTTEQLELCNSMQNSPLNFKNFLPLYLKYLITPDYPLDHKYAYLKEEEQGISQLKDQDELNRKHIARYLENLEKMERLTRLGAEVETLKWHQERVRRLGDTAKAEITGIKIGEKVLVSAPIEPLTAVGVKLKELYGEKVVLLSYSNGYLHYGALRDKYETGAYETRECDLSPLWEKSYFDAVAQIMSHFERSK